jgi:uncharacterized membrane protein
MTRLVDDVSVVPGPWPLIATGLLLGGRLLHLRRRFVLFLRRFGYTEATRTVSRAAARIGGLWRMITLDDAQIVPIGTGAAARAALGTWDHVASAVQRVSPVAAGLVKIVAWMSIIGAVLLTGAYLARSGQLANPVPLAQSALDFHYAATSATGEWFLICARALAICAALVALWLVWIVLMILGMPVSIVMMSLADDIREADQGKTIMVADRSAIAAAHTQFTARRQKNTSSRLTVLRVEPWYGDR